MGRIKLDNRIRVLIENGMTNKHRTIFLITGPKARDQVVTLHHILSKASVSQRPSVLWCYKKNLGFSSHRQKRINEIKKKKEAGIRQSKGEDIFEQFIAATHVHYCYYAESQRILGNTFGMVVLQDFEALTPNLLARTVETVQGGGIVVFLLETINSIKQIYTLSMDIHKRYRTEAYQNVFARFNERFILSLTACKAFIALDECLNVLPISSSVLKIEPIPPNLKNQKSQRSVELEHLKQTMADTRPIGQLLKLCLTVCQAKTLLRLLDVISERSLNSTCSITSARGRGKSAAMGLAIAGAVAFGLTNIFVTSPSPENLRTLFEFVLNGFSALGYAEHADYSVEKTVDAKVDKCINRVNIFRTSNHRQTIQYISPKEATRLGQAELVVVDEAAAIPIPLVRQFISGNYAVFLASTISGYEGTGRSLSLKLLEQLRKQSKTGSEKSIEDNADTGSSDVSLLDQRGGLAFRILHELTLEESIRYNENDPVENWLHQLLCLNPINLNSTVQDIPPPDKCELYYVNRDALFSFHPGAELFLSQMMSIYISSHYKNTPDDLQMLSDAPAHHIFVLLAPISPDQTSVPQILAVLQVCLEGMLSKQRVTESQQQGRKVAGDMIPWTISQNFLDNDFATLRGLRIVRIAVHPNYSGMGYGSQCIKLLKQFYNGHFKDNSANDNNIENKSKNNTKSPKKLTQIKKKQGQVRMLDNTFDNDPSNSEDDTTPEAMETDTAAEQQQDGLVEPKRDLPPLFARLSDIVPDRLDYFGVSFGLTLELLKFWKRQQFSPVYIRQGLNQLTGEHTCIMLCETEQQQSRLGEVRPHFSDETTTNGNILFELDEGWVGSYFFEFRRRLISLLGNQFSEFSTHLALSLLYLTTHPARQRKGPKVLSREELRILLTDSDLKRLSQFCRNLADDNLIADLMPTIANIYFNDRIELQQELDVRQAAALMAVGLQYKTIDRVARELHLPVSQTHALLNKATRRISEHLDTVCREAIEQRYFSVLPIPLPITNTNTTSNSDQHRHQNTNISSNNSTSNGGTGLVLQQEEQQSRSMKITDRLTSEPVLFSSLDNDHQPELLPKRKRRRRGPIPS